MYKRQLYGHWIVGALLVGAGSLLRWSVKQRAPRILLHLATHVASVYEQAREHGVMEVKRRDAPHQPSANSS